MTCKDTPGRQADVHALRYTLCTNLSRAGVAVQTAMQIMRHNDIKLTTRIYLDAGQLPRSDAMNLVPTFAPAEAGQRSHGRSLDGGIQSHGMAQTGTDDDQAGNGKTADYSEKLHKMAQAGIACQDEGENSSKATLFISSRASLA